MTLKQTINNALRGFTDGADFAVAADALVRGLGYASELISWLVVRSEP